MTQEEAIKILKAGADMIDYPHSYEEFEEALMMAVDALHAQRTPEKLDRSRWGNVLTVGFGRGTIDSAQTVAASSPRKPRRR